MHALINALNRILWILLLDAFMSFIVFGTTATVLAGPKAGMVAFVIGLLLMLPSAVEAYDEQNGKQHGSDPGKPRSAREIVLEEIIPHRKSRRGSRSVTPWKRR